MIFNWTNKKNKNKIYSVLFFLAVVLIFILVIIFIVEAGSLTPSAAPAPTMSSVGEIYNALAGDYDSSSISASSTGNALQIAKCAITKINGGNCN